MSYSTYFADLASGLSRALIDTASVTLSSSTTKCGFEASTSMVLPLFSLSSSIP